MSLHDDLKIAVERGDLDAWEALDYMAEVVERQLDDPMLLTSEREALEAGLELADRTLMDVAVDEWAAEALDLPLTNERN